jgi:hypothetical protein
MRHYAPVLALVLAALYGCSNPPSGPDLLACTCVCFDECTGLNISGPAQACTTATDQQSINDGCQQECKSKETIGFNVCKVRSCSEVSAALAIKKGCPSDELPCPNGGNGCAGGDFGAASAVSVSPTSLTVSGNDVHAFSVTPDLAVQTTQTGGQLVFADMRGTLPTTTFTTSGIFTDSDHTFADGNVFLVRAAFATRASDGSYELPTGEAHFIVTGELDGDRVSILATNNQPLSGAYHEDTGVFTLTGSVVADTADVHLAVAATFQFVNRPPVAVAGGDQTVECVSPAGLGHVHLSGAGSSDPDGFSDIQAFVWHVDDGTPAAQTVSGETVDVDVTGLGGHAVELAVIDSHGSSSIDTATATVQDSTPPAIAITQPAATQYSHSATLVLAYTVGDVCTGVQGFTPLMDGAATVGGDGLQSGQAIPLLTQVNLGFHTFTVSATDNAGNASSSSVTFEIIVTATSIGDDVAQFLKSGAITKLTVANSLLSKLDAAAQARVRGKCNTAANTYVLFINEVQAQTGKSIDPAAATILIADAQYLITHCP